MLSLDLNISNQVALALFFPAFVGYFFIRNILKKRRKKISTLDIITSYLLPFFIFIGIALTIDIIEGIPINFPLAEVLSHFLLLPFIVTSLILIFNWQNRQRSGGRIRLQIKNYYPRFFSSILSILFLILYAAIVSAIAISPYKNSTNHLGVSDLTTNIFNLSTIFIFFGPLIALSLIQSTKKIEIRDKAFCYLSEVISWNNVISYDWGMPKDSLKSPFRTLNLNLKSSKYKLINWFRPIRKITAYIPLNDIPAVEASIKEIWIEKGK